MKTAFHQSFLRDVKKIKQRPLLKQIEEIIEEVESAHDLGQIRGIKKLTGTKSYYRIRIGDHRIGAALERETLQLIRCLPRKELYRYFP